MRKGGLGFLLFLLVLLLFLLNYSWMDALLADFVQEDKEIANVSRVVDGDTLKLENGETVRLLGINTPERGEEYYQEAKEFLREKAEGKEIILESTAEDKDKYGRLLRHVFLGNEHVNKELIEQGYANPYFLGDKRYELEFRRAWERCVERNLRLCEESHDICADCILLERFDHEKQQFTLKNACESDCEISGWVVKEEGRKHFEIPKFFIGTGKEITVICGKGTDNSAKIFLVSCDNVWTATGDTLYLRDAEGKLVLYKNY